MGADLVPRVRTDGRTWQR